MEPIFAGRAPKLRGIITPVVTPFKNDRSVDYKAWENLIGWLIEHDVDGLFVGGGSGEWIHLESEERVELVRRAAAVAGGEVPIIAGSLGHDFDETLRLSRVMADAGADFLGIVIPRFGGTHGGTPHSSTQPAVGRMEFVPPRFASPLESPVCAFFERLAKVFPYPTMLYDPPGSGEYGMQPLWLRRLAAVGPIIGLKKSTRDLRTFSQLLEAGGEGFAMLAGDETVMFPCLALGAVGCIGGGGNMFPELMRAVFEAFEQGDWKAARRAHYELERANRLIERCGWPLSGKIALAARGLRIKPITRCNSKPVRSEDHERLVEYFRKGRFLKENWA